jgi:hypothetical protein
MMRGFAFVMIIKPKSAESRQFHQYTYLDIDTCAVRKSILHIIRLDLNIKIFVPI